MLELINASICVSDIPRDLIHVADNGKKYISVCITQLREPDRYENTHSIYMRQSKEEREAKADRIYIGKGKALVFSPAAPSPESVSALPVADEVDDLPF